MDLFDERNPEHLPSLKMELVYDDEKMQFYPPYDELLELVLGIVDIISKSLQQVCGCVECVGVLNVWVC